MPQIALPFASTQQIADLESMIKYILNATATWGGTVSDKRRLTEAITRSRIYGTLEVIRAIARNPQHGYYGVLMEMVDVAHNDQLPAHEGSPGIPTITPSSDDPTITMTGEPAEPAEIDSYRNDTLGLYTRSGGETVAHDALDSNGQPSVVAGYYSFQNGQVKFAGARCQVPLIQMDEESIALYTPATYISTIVKLAPLWNLKEGDNLVGIAQTLVADGKADLQAIEGGSLSVSPFFDVMKAQKAD
jgi:hypothetical protein